MLLPAAIKRSVVFCGSWIRPRSPLLSIRAAVLTVLPNSWKRAHHLSIHHQFLVYHMFPARQEPLVHWWFSCILCIQSLSNLAIMIACASCGLGRPVTARSNGIRLLFTMKPPQLLQMLDNFTRISDRLDLENFFAKRLYLVKCLIQVCQRVRMILAQNSMQ